MSETIVYTSPCVIAAENRIIRGGAVVVQSNRIVDVDCKGAVANQWPGAQIIARRGLLLPPLINCHTHLELSHLKDISPPKKDSGMTGWIEEVLNSRQQQKITPQEFKDFYIASLRQQSLSGVVLAADITNSVNDNLPQYYDFTEVCQIMEMIAPTEPRTSVALELLETLPPSLHVSPHSPYSTSAQLIKVLKKRSLKNHHVFSIHLAESAAEINLYRSQSGEFRQFLEKRNSWDGSLLSNTAADGGVFYLDKLGVVDEKTLCVHCVHISEEEIAILAEKKVKICICPGSNVFLGVGTAPLEKIVQAGILPGIGTDSRASNERLDMWREMQILRQQFPNIPAETIFSMATLGGARSLNRERDYGTIEKGKKAVLLEVVADEILQLADTDIVDMLISGGKPEKLGLISPGNK